MKIFIKAVIVLAFVVFSVGLYLVVSRDARIERRASEKIIDDTWTGYKHYFIDEKGRVMRPKEGDTVSEGQAYAMLRAVWMNDKETFDKCYCWAEKNISRKAAIGDNLLAWHWGSNRVRDWMPASDADIDYALSLIFADSMWRGKAPKCAGDYGKKAKNILSDVMRFETHRSPGGRLYLTPWIMGGKRGTGRVPINPSYYSPAHFRIFYAFTRDPRWLELKDTSYYLLDSLLHNFKGLKGVGIIPDWCSVDKNDRFHPLERKNSDFGWEAVRIPFRVAMDYFWFGSSEAADFLESSFAGFIEREWIKNGCVYSEYSYNGISENKYENPLFYASYATTLLVTESEYSKLLLEKSREYIKEEDGFRIYQGPEEYYVNSLAWFTEGFISKKIRRLD